MIRVLLLTLVSATATLAQETTSPADAPTNEAPPPAQTSLTLDVGGPIVIGLTINTLAIFLETQAGVHDHFSLIVETSYLTSDSVRNLDGTSTNLRMNLGILCLGGAYWFDKPFEGPFISVRGEAWLAAAENPSTHVAVFGNQWDANFQPGWQWRFGVVTVIASLSLAYVTGPITSADGTVAFPLAGFSGTPHLRIGAAW
jgi:hypothetical protein